MGARSPIIHRISILTLSTASVRGANVIAFTVDLAACLKISDEHAPTRMASGSPTTLIAKLTVQLPFRSRAAARLGYLKSLWATGWISELKAIENGLGSARSSAQADGRTLATPAAKIICDSFMTKTMTCLQNQTRRFACCGAAIAAWCITERPHATVANSLRALSSMPDPAAPGSFTITTFEVTAPLKMLSHWSFTLNIAVRHPIADEQSQYPIRYEIGAEALVAARVGADGVLYTSTCDAPRWPENDYRAALYLAPAS